MPDSAAMRQFTHRLTGYRSLSGLLPTVCFVTPTSSGGTQLAAHQPGEGMVRCTWLSVVAGV